MWVQTTEECANSWRCIQYNDSKSNGCLFRSECQFYSFAGFILKTCRCVALRIIAVGDCGYILDGIVVIVLLRIGVVKMSINVIVQYYWCICHFLEICTFLSCVNCTDTKINIQMWSILYSWVGSSETTFKTKIISFH